MYTRKLFRLKLKLSQQHNVSFSQSALILNYLIIFMNKCENCAHK